MTQPPDSRRPGDDRDDRLEAWLDSRFAASSSEPAPDEDLHEGLALQRLINDSLRRSFEPPPPPAPEALLRALAQEAAKAPVAGSILPRSRTWRAAVIAASLALGAFGIWRIVETLSPEVVDPYAQPFRTFAGVYEHELETGFEPAWVCENDRQFFQFVWPYFRRGILMQPPPEGTVVAGLDVSNSLSEDTLYVLGQTQGHRLLVFIDTADHDRPEAVDEWAGAMNLFRRELDGFVLYELSPLAEPTLLNTFYVPDEVPTEWIPRGARPGPGEG